MLNALRPIKNYNPWDEIYTNGFQHDTHLDLFNGRYN